MFNLLKKKPTSGNKITIGDGLYLINGEYYYDQYNSMDYKSYCIKVVGLFSGYNKIEDIVYWLNSWKTTPEHEAELVRLFRRVRKERIKRRKEDKIKYEKRLKDLKSIK